MNGWDMRVVHEDGQIVDEHFDEDEIGTLDDTWTGFMITGLENITSIKIEKA